MLTWLNALLLGVSLLTLIVIGLRFIRHERNPSLWALALATLGILIQGVVGLFQLNLPWLLIVAVILELLAIVINIQIMIDYRKQH
ncbi:hypothetical protein [Lacticaseibacillus brantae]|uniref:hypothetical protein n=1 Tax=Lacticaseibacillus brantae TaxID=943673 RepID=UPI00070B5F64|nr:hypothetical protein [Lacticaseibacillus brantae]